MVSIALPGTAAPNVNESLIHMAQVSSYYACAQDGYLKHPHPTNIEGDMRWEGVGFWVILELGDIGHVIS